MSFRGRYINLYLLLILSACAEQSSLVLPLQQERANAEESYKQCVSHATVQLIAAGRSADAVVRSSMDQCSSLRYSMLSTYPERWREHYARHLDAEVYQQQLSLIREQQNTQLAN